MHGGPDPLGAPSSSFTARRSAASNLPGAFELPPPHPLQNISSHKYPGFSTNNSSQPPMAANGIAASAGVGNLLTPPNTLHGDYTSPLSPSAASSGSNQTTSAHAYPHSNSYWAQAPPPQSAHSAQYAPYSAPTGTTPQQQQQQQWIPPRGMFNSPSSLNGIVSDSKPAQPTPAHDLYQLPPFGSSSSLSAPSSMASATSGTAGSTASPASQQEPFHLRSSSASSSYYQPHSTVHQFPSGPSPTQQNHPRMSPLSAPHQGAAMYGSAPGSQTYQQREYNQYPAAPVMNNLHANAPMGMVSGMSSGMMGGYHGGHGGMQHMYSMPPHSQQPAPPNDRPFKCDQCMQSFNRNHDLKRHKRIHLAVKPYPCGHCDKSFSRKDALKRHILVKGCGKAHTAEDSEKMSSASTSPVSSKGESQPSHSPLDGLRR